METNYEFKDGYAEGTQFIEVFNGNLDLIIYNSESERVPRFYYHRFGKISNYLGTEESYLALSNYNNKSVSSRKEMNKVLAIMGKEYDSFLIELLNVAQERGLPAKYDA